MVQNKRILVKDIRNTVNELMKPSDLDSVRSQAGEDEFNFKSSQTDEYWASTDNKMRNWIKIWDISHDNTDLDYLRAKRTKKIASPKKRKIKKCKCKK